MGKYGTGKSVYCYAGTDVLINVFDIKDEIRLRELDAIFTSKRLSELQLKPLEGNLDFDHFKAIHYYIFQDLYPFAGKLRTENISKGSFTFAQAVHLQNSGEELFSRLQKEKWSGLGHRKTAELLAYYMAEMNVLHPFRDGNGRATREFIRILADSSGYDLDWTRSDKRMIFQASVASTVDLIPLTEVMMDLIAEKVSDGG